MLRTTILTGIAGFVLLLTSCSNPPVEEIKGSASELTDAWPAATPSDADWPWWRGPSGDARAAGSEEPPVRFGPSENVLWKAAIAGRGHASPIVWGQRVLVATADEAAGTQSLVCLDRTTGEPMWTTALHTGGLMDKHGKNTHASPTPACDGRRIYLPLANSGSLWLSAVDLDGNLAWQLDLGPFEARHGYGSSPAIWGPLVIVLSDNSEGAFLAGVNRKTGELVWRTARANEQSYGSPVVAHVAGRDQVIVSGANTTAGYDPDNGVQLWHCEGPSDVTANTAACDPQHVFVSGGYSQKNLLCIRADGSGDVTDSHVQWQVDRKGVAYVPSPLWHAGRLWLVDGQGGILTCFEAETGQKLYQKRIGGGFSASPLLVGELILAPDEQGRVHVWRAGKAFEEVAVNDLGEPIFASPVFCGGQLFLRTEGHLYCIAGS